MRNPFRYFNSSPEVIRLTVMLYIRYPLSLRQVEDLLFERGIDICHGGVKPKWLEAGEACPQPLAMRNPFRYFKSSPEVIRLTVMLYIRYPLSLRQVDDLLFERGIDICHETVGL